MKATPLEKMKTIGKELKRKEQELKTALTKTPIELTTTTPLTQADNDIDLTPQEKRELEREKGIYPITYLVNRIMYNFVNTKPEIE